jgi:hypothetical protein
LIRALPFLLLAGCASSLRLTPSEARAEGVDTLQVYVAGASEPVFGETTREGGALVFRPRFPFKPGTPYRVVAGDVERVITLPEPPATSTSLERVYPTSDVVPENHLKFYLHFSGPMARGELYRRVSLWEGSRKIEAAFLELGEELWDREQRRATLLLDPGRIKRGLRPHEEEGPALERGKTYTLVVDAAWPDAAGRPLSAGGKKTFRVVDADERRPELRDWTAVEPKAGTREPLELRFPEPLDAGLLARVLRVEGVEGEVELGPEERSWRFTPRAPWRAGEHALLVDAVLEDLAGNNLERLFEVDELTPSTRKISARVLRLPFRVNAGASPQR